MRTGTRYARLLIVTAEPRRALKAVEEPRYKHPRIAIMAVTASCAFKGMRRVGWTLDQLRGC